MSAEAEPPKNIPHMGYLSSLSPSSDSARAEAIRQALRELGYVEGRNIAIEYRYAEGKRNRFPQLAAKLVHQKVDIIVVAAGDVLTGEAKNATTTIPIVNQMRLE